MRGIGLNSHRQINQVLDNLSARHLRGKDRPLRLAMTALLCGGHILIEDVPGLGKTTLALALSGTLGLSFGRVQCTSDLLPSDITGMSIYERREERFRFIKGPIFNNVLLVDEINRAMPKTQSALLEAMEERRVTVDGVTYPLPDPFVVIATQNPVEQVGTYPLPESQLDRFSLRTGIGYPPRDIEREIIRGGSLRHRLADLKASLHAPEILQARGEAAATHLSVAVTDYICDLVEATRTHPMILSGISTRGGIDLAAAGRACAFLDGRDHVAPEDIQEMATAVFAHRLILRPEQAHQDREEILRSLLQKLPVPTA